MINLARHHLLLHGDFDLLIEVRRNHAVEWLSVDLIGGVPEHAGKPTVGIHNAPLGIGDDDGIFRSVDDERQQLQTFVFLMMSGNVLMIAA